MDSKLLNDINSRIGDRSESFYWQTDRKISVEEASMIWKDRHSLISNEELLDKVNNSLDGIKLSYIKPFNENDETSLGNVNSLRVGVLDNGDEVVIRCHPKGIKNSYFYVESLAASTAITSGIPTYKTYIIHELENENDIAYQVIEKLNGYSIQFYLESNPEKEKDIVYEMGRTMYKLHQVQVNGFGPFDNEKAKENILIGIHNTLNDSINAGLDENLNRLVGYSLFSKEIADKIKKLFINNKLLNTTNAVLVHNDFADWNLLTDGITINAVLDWDECVGGDPIQDIACWSTFFEPSRLEYFLNGYYSNDLKPDDFEQRFQLMRLRYTISKMALRLRRYEYEKTDFLKTVIDRGEKHLNELIVYFELDK